MTLFDRPGRLLEAGQDEVAITFDIAFVAGDGKTALEGGFQCGAVTALQGRGAWTLLGVLLPCSDGMGYDDTLRDEVRGVQRLGFALQQAYDTGGTQPPLCV